MNVSSFKFRVSSWAAASGAALALMLVMPLAAQAPGVAHIQAPAKIAARAHAQVTAVFQVRIDPGFHIQSNHPKLDYLIPTTLTVTPAGGVKVLKVAWPAAAEHKFSFAPDPLTVFEGVVKIPVTLATGAAGHTTLHGSFGYQACNDQLCRPPVTVPFTFQVDVR